MRKLSQSLVLSLLSTCLAAAVGCGGGDSSSFKNSLTFGASLGGTGFDLIGESKTFSLAALSTQPQIYFKLESADDMAGRAIRLYFDSITNKDFTNPQSYGHILLSAFAASNVGTYDVQGHLVAQVGPDIGKETFVARSDLTITP